LNWLYQDIIKMKYLLKLKMVFCLLRDLQKKIKKTLYIKVLLKDFLKDYWYNHVTFEEFPVVGTRLSLDFYNANKRVAVEVQGSQHTKYNKFFHGGHKNNYLEQLKRDQIKAEFCEVNDIILVEIYDSDIINKSLFKKFDVTL